MAEGLSREEVLAMVPQQEPFRFIDEIVELDAEHIVARHTFSPDADFYRGHFPGNPIMPGVCMMQIIKEITEKVLDKKLFLQTSTNIKFMAKINPNVNPDLSIQITYSEEEGMLKIKNNSYFEDTLALKLNAKYKIIA